MAHRYALKLISLAIVGAIPFRGLAQGDTCTTALEIVSGVHYCLGPTSGSAGPGNCGSTSGNNGRWYKFTPGFTGTIIINSCHPLNAQGSVDTYLRVLTGSCDNLVCVIWNDDGGPNGAPCPVGPFASYAAVSVVAGEQYFIAWTDEFSNSGFFWELSECAGTVTGVTYRDSNGNGTRDAGEPHVNAMLSIDPGGMNTYSGSDPYSFCSSLGDYTLTVPNPPLYHSVTPASQSYSLSAQGEQVTGMNFGFQPVPGIHDASVSLWGQNAWIGNNTQLHVGYENLGSEPVNATISLTLDLALSFVSASVAPTSIGGQTITWALPTLAPFSAGSINVTVFTATTTAPLAPVLNYVVLTATENDIDLANNQDDQHATAVTAIDPNDKHVSRATITPDDVADQKRLEYTINFQNTGTAPAVNIIVKDSLDADWDLSTFEMIGATHPYSLTVNEQVAIWTFSNILLPDSTTNEPASHGSIHYRMAPKTNVMLGDQITNRADIYFDYNEAVLTNTTVTTVELSTGIEALTHGELFVVPSPSDGQVSLRWTDAHLNSASLTVIDALGRTVHTARMNSAAQNGRIDLSFLADGSYVARLHGHGTETWARFVIRR